MTPLVHIHTHTHLYYFPRGSKHHVYVAMSNVPHYLRNTSKADKLVNL